MNNQSKGLIEFYKYLQVAKEAAQHARNIGGHIGVPDADFLLTLEYIETEINEHLDRFDISLCDAFEKQTEPTAKDFAEKSALNKKLESYTEDN